MSATETQQEVRAVAKWVRTSPRKARLVVDHIRGRTVPEARTILAFTPRAAAREVEKVLRSAVANAEANHGMVGDRLVVSAAYVDEGPIIKRWRARARGRVARIRKPTCHITVKVAELNGAAATPAPADAATPAVATPQVSKRSAAGPEEGEAPRQRRRTAPKADEKTSEKSPRKKSEPKAETSSEEKPKRTTRKKKED
jgi:large subunit ribosomal protein L22